MTRHLFILSRRDPDLYSYLKERFADDDAVEIIVDRRHAAPQAGQARAIHSDGQDRRCRPDADAELLVRSYTVVTVSDVPGSSRHDPRVRRSSRLRLRPTA